MLVENDILNKAYIFGSKILSGGGNLLVIILCLAGFFSLVIIPRDLRAGPVQDTVNFLESDTPTKLVNPESVRVSRAGTVAVWDSHLQDFQFFTSGDSPEISWDKFLNKEEQVRKFERWNVTGKREGVWTDTTSFWYYDPEVAARADSVYFFNIRHPADTFALSGPIKSFITGEEYWLIQHSNGVVEKREPVPGGDILNTALVETEAKLVGKIDTDSFIFRDQETIFLYNREGEEIRRVNYNGLRAVKTVNEFVYILLEEGRILKLDKDFNEDFAFNFVDDFTFRDMAFYDETVYIVAEEGLYLTELNESGRSFFYAGASVYLSEICAAGESFLKKSPGTANRIWSGGENIYLWDGDRSREVPLSAGKFNGRGEFIKESRVPLTAFQYFQSPHTTWDGDTLYYYFPDEQLVEAYDSRGSVAKSVILEQSREYINNTKFLGASKKNILFSGELIRSSGQKNRAIIVYDWDGELQRILQPVHPAEENIPPQPDTYPRFEYTGGDLIYDLYSNHIQTYDLYGYPSQKIGGLLYPRDVTVDQEGLYILDARGYRVIRREQPAPRHVRFATSSEQPPINEALMTGPGEAIITVGPPDKAYLARYEAEEQEIRKILEHPTRSLRYPVASGGDTIYFWGEKQTRRESLLYRFDSQRYVASEMGYSEAIREPVDFDNRKNILLVPRKLGPSDTLAYAYFDPQSETEGIIRNSQNLELILPEGPTGYTGVIKSGDKFEITGGFLEGEPATGPLYWRSTDTYLEVDDPVKQLVFLENKFLLAQEEGSAQTRLLTYSFLPADRAGGGPGKNSYFTGYGQLRWLEYGEEQCLLLWKSAGFGRLVNTYSSPPKTGGIAGNVDLDVPGTAEGIEILTEPGGQMTKTNTGGEFTLNGVQTGYLKVFPPSSRYHFEQPLVVRVNSAQYTVDQRASLRSVEELGLLERGLKNYRNSELSRARIAMEAFRSMVESGPYFTWTARPLFEIYRAENNINGLRLIYENHPRVFSSTEQYRFWKRLKSGEKAEELLKSLLSRVHGLEKNIIAYKLWRKQFLEKGTMNKYLSPPLLSEDSF